MADIILFLLFLISVIYCCDHQAYKGFEFLIHDHNSMWYGVGLSIIAAYIFYLIQIYLPAIKNKLKYADFITAKLYVLKNDMRQTIRILLGKELDDLDELRRGIEHQIQQRDIFLDGSGKYRAIDEEMDEEMVLVDALWENEWKIHRDILELISFNILGKQTTELMIRVEMLPLRDKIEAYMKNKPVRHRSIKEKRGMGIGGCLVYNKSVLDRELTDIMKEYIDALEEVEKFLNCLHGSGIRVFTGILRL